MSKTPVFDEVVATYPKDLWASAPRLFPSPPHKPECPYDGYNWHVCTCGHWDTKTGRVYCCDGSKGDDCDCTCHGWKPKRTWCGKYLCCREKDHSGACEVDDTLLTWEGGVSRET